MKYKILWNDDRYEKYESSSELQEYPEFEFDFVKYQDTCLEILKGSPDQYDAVILDANGTSSEHPEREPNKGEYFHTLVDKACENKKLLTFIFSGELHPDSSDPNESGINKYLAEKGFMKGKNLFSKTLLLEMLEQLKNDLNNYNSWRKYYNGYEYLLDFVEKEWLSPTQRVQNLDPIMRALHERDKTSNVGNNMRHILRALLKVCNDKYGIIPDPEDEIGVLHSLTRNYVADPLVSPFIGPMWNIHYATNAKSHVTFDPKLLDLFFYTTFDSFLLTTHFFHKVLNGSVVLNNNQPRSITPIILKINDKDNLNVYSGDYQIRINNEWRDRLGKNSVIKVLKSVHNTVQGSPYKYYVGPHDYEIIDDET